VADLCGHCYLWIKYYIKSSKILYLPLHGIQFAQILKQPIKIPKILLFCVLRDSVPTCVNEDTKYSRKHNPTTIKPFKYLKG